MNRYLILAIICSFCTVGSNYAAQVGVPQLESYVETSAIKRGHRADVSDILRRYPQNAARLKELKKDIGNMSRVAQSDPRYGKAVRVSVYLPYNVAGKFADVSWREYDEIIARIGLNRHLMQNRPIAK